VQPAVRVLHAARRTRLAPHADQLTDDEVVRLVRIGVELLGIREVRFTGGEPLLRRGLAGIVARTRNCAPARRSR
jgi:cyclic pyranopterin phosphate synthase